MGHDGWKGLAIRQKVKSPEAIAEWLKWYDSLEPLIFGEEELAAWEACRRARKEWEKARFNQHAEEMRSLWE